MDKFIEIPFGAFDSELKGWEYTIPEGMEARVENGKIVVREKDSIDSIILDALLIHFRHKSKPTWNGFPVRDILTSIERLKNRVPPQDTEKEYIRTIKSLIADFIRGKDHIDTVYYQKIYDWLDGRHVEEQKPTAEEVLLRAGLKSFKDGNQWCVLAGDNIQEGVCGFGDTIEDALFEFLKEVCKQKEQKRADLSEMMVPKEPNIAPVPIPIVADEQKPVEWGEEDEKKLSAVISLMKSNRAVNPSYDKMCLEGWLKSLPERFNLQSRQERSEEDDKILNELLDHCNTENATWYNWVKSRRPQLKYEDRYMEGYQKGFADAEKAYNKGASYHMDNPNIYKLDPNVVIDSTTGGTYGASTYNCWKPSEEQVESLGHIINHYTLLENHIRKNIESLYNDLKKLM